MEKISPAEIVMHELKLIRKQLDLTMIKVEALIPERPVQYDPPRLQVFNPKTSRLENITIKKKRG